MKLTLGIVLVFTVTGAFGQVTPEQQRDRAAIQALVKSLNVLAKSDLRCRDSVDCAVIPVGHRACGGPSAFVVASRLNQNYDEVENLAQKSSELEMAYNFKYRVVSICSLVRPPVAACVKKVCTSH